MGKMGIQPIIPVPVTHQKIKSAAFQRYGDGNGVVQCEHTFKVHITELVANDLVIKLIQDIRTLTMHIARGKVS